MVAAVCPEAKLRKLVKNMVYVGVVAKLLAIDMAEVEKAGPQAVREEAESGRPEPRGGQGRLRLCRRQPGQKGSLLHRARWTRRKGKIIIDGNCGRSSGRYVCGSDGGGLVPDHAVVVAGRER